jgi:hypothetical protein
VGSTPFGTSPAANTLIDIGPAGARYPTTYFLAPISLDLSLLRSLTNCTLYLLCELGDGAIVYVNGVEVFRSYLPAGPISPSTYTDQPSAGLGWLQAPVDIALLDQYNVVAVEMHQNGPDSDQLFFDLGLVSHLSGNGLTLTLETSDEGLYLHWEGQWYWDSTEENSSWWFGWLQEADNLTGPWRDVENYPQGRYFFSPGGQQRFFRLVWP